MMRALEITGSNVKHIANSGVVDIEDAQALWEHIQSLGLRKYFVIDYRDKTNRLYEWATVGRDAFEDEFVWLEREHSGFRTCRRR